MKILKILVIMLVLITSVGAVCATDALSDDVMIEDGEEIINAVPDIEMSDTLEIVQDDVYSAGEGSFMDLYSEIYNETSVFDMTRDYKFNNETDVDTSINQGIFIKKDNFIINGNGHTVDGNGQSRIFSISGKNITISNLKIINGNSDRGSAIFVNPGFDVTTTNMTFDNNKASGCGGAVYVGGQYTSVNDRFVSNDCAIGSAICVSSGTLNLNNGTFISDIDLGWGLVYSYKSSLNVEDSNFTSSNECNFSAVYGELSDMYVDNCLFYNFTSRYACAIYVLSSNLGVINSRFSNLKARMSAGAIFAKNSDYILVENSTFANISSKKNGGAILFDFCDSNGLAFLTGCDFTNCSSDFGGAILQLDGHMFITGCRFKNNTARRLGGAIYNAYVDLNVMDSTFEENGAGNFSAIYYDFGILSILKSNFTVSDPDVWAVYLRDAYASIINSTFENGRFNIYGDFMRSCLLEGNILDTSTISIDNENYVFSVQNSALPLNLTRNVINVSDYPSRFDLRDWGWVTPVKNQGIMGACWAFATIECIETALLRATGIRYDLSENNLKDFEVRYSQYGYNICNEASNGLFSLGYLLSWMGPVFEEEDEYDEMGKTSWYIQEGDRIRIQDAIIIFPHNMSYVNDIKRTIINYGAVIIGYNSSNQYFNKNTSAHYSNETNIMDHAVAIIGWDDNYSADNFLITPPGNGAWIIKNSWGTDRGEEGYFYLSYYEASIFTIDGDAGEPWPLVALVFENPISYHVNYQTDLSGIYYFDDNYTQYSNEYDAVSDDLIGAVGTYFRYGDSEYSFDIYVNGKLVHSQSGINDLPGYWTIVLDRYVSISEGDRFKIAFRSTSLPYQSDTRQHVKANVSMASADGEVWIDLADVGRTACLKVYTVADDSGITDNKNIAVDYDGGSYFSVKVVTGDGHVAVGEAVKFRINNVDYYVTADKNGMAKIKIKEAPGTYTIKTVCNGKTYTNKVTVKQVLTTSKVTVKKTASKFTLKAKLKINGKLVKGKTVTFRFNGKTYKAKTNSKGIAQKTLNKNVIKKLKKGKTYTVKVTYLKDTIKTTVKVK